MTRLILVAVALLVSSTVPGRAGQTQPTVLLQETFDDNDAGWKEQRTSWIRTGVEDGVFRISTQVNLQQTVVRNVAWPATGDFDIACTVETRRGNPEWPFGLVWGYRNPANFLEYVIWMDGRLRITRSASLDTQSLVPETETADLHTGFATNELKLVLAALLPRVDLESTLDHPLATVRRNATLAPEDGVPVRIVRRH